MPTAHIATTGAIAFSGTTLVLCLAGIFTIWSEMHALWMDLDQQMDQFRVRRGIGPEANCQYL
jgi:hypothetical protein